MMKFIALLVIIILVSCNQNTETAEDKPAGVIAAPKIAPPEDSVTIKLRGAVTAIETKELQYASVIKSMSIVNIRHEMISMKAYYQLQKEQLKQNFHLSSDKEKTTRALTYLDVMAAKSSVKPNVYKVQFHLNALLSNSTRYNEDHTKYLNEDLTEISLIFP